MPIHKYFLALNSLDTLFLFFDDAVGAYVTQCCCHTLFSFSNCSNFCTSFVHTQTLDVFKGNTQFEEVSLPE